MHIYCSYENKLLEISEAEHFTNQTTNNFNKLNALPHKLTINTNKKNTRTWSSPRQRWTDTANITTNAVNALLR